MERASLVFCFLGLILQFQTQARGFPQEADEPLVFDARVNIEDLKADAIVPDVIKEAYEEDGVTYYYFQLDYSTLVTLPFSRIVQAMSDYEAYPCYMPSMKKAEIVDADFPGSRTNPEENRTTMNYGITYVVMFNYFLDVTGYPRPEETKRFSSTWVQNDALQSNVAFNQFRHHAGSWTIEPFDVVDGQERFYSRYRDTVSLVFMPDEGAYKRALAKSVRQIFNGGRDEGKGIYNYNRDCL